MSTTTTPARPRRALPPLMTLTDAAAERLSRLYAKGEAGKLLRIGVKTKGSAVLAGTITAPPPMWCRWPNP